MMTSTDSTELRTYESIGPMLKDVDSSQCRVFEQSIRRNDADPEFTQSDETDPDEQEFSFEGVTEVGDNSLTVRVKVGAENTDGHAYVDLAVRYRWQTNISLPDDLVYEFTQQIALPEAMTYVRMTFRQLSTTSSIRSIELPTQAFLPNSWQPAPRSTDDD